MAPGIGLWGVGVRDQAGSCSKVSCCAAAFRMEAARPPAVTCETVGEHKCAGVIMVGNSNIGIVSSFYFKSIFSSLEVYLQVLSGTVMNLGLPR